MWGVLPPSERHPAGWKLGSSNSCQAMGEGSSVAQRLLAASERMRRGPGLGWGVQRLPLRAVAPMLDPLLRAVPAGIRGRDCIIDERGRQRRRKQRRCPLPQPPAPGKALGPRRRAAEQPSLARGSRSHRRAPGAALLPRLQTSQFAQAAAGLGAAQGLGGTGGQRCSQPWHCSSAPLQPTQRWCCSFLFGFVLPFFQPASVSRRRFVA